MHVGRQLGQRVEKLGIDPSASRMLYHLSYIPMLAHQAKPTGHIDNCRLTRTGANTVAQGCCGKLARLRFCLELPLLTKRLEGR